VAVSATGHSKAAAASIDYDVLRVNAHLGWFLAKPLSFVDTAHESLSALPLPALKDLAVQPEFAAPLNRAIGTMLGLESLAITGELVKQLSASRAGRMAVAMLTAAEATLEQAAAVLAAAIIHRQVASAIMKEERNKLRQLLGNDLFHLAVHEAPVMHAPLAELDRARSDQPQLAANGLAEERRAHVMAVGWHGLLGFLDATEPLLSGLFLLRVPRAVRTGAPREMLLPMSLSHRDHVVKLLGRRVGVWAAILH
jgi:hypothetical protein